MTKLFVEVHDFSHGAVAQALLELMLLGNGIGKPQFAAEMFDARANSFAGESVISSHELNWLRELSIQIALSRQRRARDRRCSHPPVVGQLSEIPRKFVNV